MVAEPKIQWDAVKGNVYLRNMLANIERTFLPVGSTIGKYRIIEEIDRGGMAVVYKATQLDLDREVALKVMPANISINRNFMERFMSEAHAVARLGHPNIVTIFEVAMEKNIYYLAMEYIPGQNLFYYLNFNKPKLIEVLEIVSTLADALAYAHQQKIIHRDLKLNNVIMKDRLTPVLIDFGLAKAMEDEVENAITRTGEVLGSPAYMAPERLLGGGVDHRSDICSLGIMLYEMLTFKNPYLDQRNLHQTALNVMEANPIPPRKLVPWLPLEIEAITLKAMAKDSANRYQSMHDFKADINRYQRNEPVLARPPSLQSRCHHFIRRHWPVLGITATAIVFAALFAMSIYIQKGKELSHWQAFYSERFGGNPAAGEWFFSPASDSQSWRYKNGTLTTHGAGFSFARLERRFNRDMKIEFDFGASGKDLYNAGFFLFGDSPDSAYCFHVNRGGDGSCGITYPGSGFLFEMTNAAKIRIVPVNHIVIERMQNSITFSINDEIVAKLWDFLPPIGKNHERLGFFSSGCSMWFDNLKIFRRAIPLTPNPTLVADRFRERGDFESALDEYRALLVDFKNAERARDVRLKIADCLIRREKFEQARVALAEAGPARSKDESFEARRLFLLGIIHKGLCAEDSADSAFKLLAQHYPASAANLSAMAFEMNRVAMLIRKENLMRAANELSILEGRYPRSSDLWGALRIMVLQDYIKKGSLDSAALAVEQTILAEYKNGAMATDAKNALGKIHLAKGRKDRAADLFNQCIAAHGSSESIWESWLDLAGIYEYDYAYPEATTIYQKIYRESPSNLPAHWMAAVKLGELGSKNGGHNFDRYFTAVANDQHPFPLPRLIARFYLGEVSEDQFKTAWNQLRPDDYHYLHYLARKAMFTNEEIVARIYLTDLKQAVSPQSWSYFLACKAINNLKKW